MKQKTMIEAFQSINKRRQSEEMPITALAMFSEAWDYKQAEIDAALKQRDSFIKAHHIAMNDVCDQKAEIDALQKRIDDALALVQADCIEYGISDYLERAMGVLKGDKND